MLVTEPEHNNTWKFAAGEICSMLQQVRVSGLSGMQELEEKIQAMLSTLTSQENQIGKYVTFGVQYCMISSNMIFIMTHRTIPMIAFHMV